MFIMMALPPFFVRLQPRENEYRFDMQFFEDAKVGFDSLGEGKRKTARGCEKGFLGAGALEELLEIICSVYAETRLGEGTELKRLQMLAVVQKI
jgi:hypothetical protein